MKSYLHTFEEFDRALHDLDFCKTLLGLTVLVCGVAIAANTYSTRNMHWSSARNAVPVAVVRSVTFLGGHSVTDDEGKLYGEPHWVDENGDGRAAWIEEASFPVCYTRGDFVSVSAVFQLGTDVHRARVHLLGKANDGIVFEGDGVVQGDMVILPPVRASKPLPNDVRFFNPFRIEWNISFGDREALRPAGTTENRLYATLASPTAEPLYETLLDIGCRNVDGVTNENRLINAIWSEFQMRQADGALPGVKRKQADGYHHPDGATMRYWVEAGSGWNARVSQQCHTLRDMLTSHPRHKELNGVGTCQAWTELFEQVLHAQGIHDSEIILIRTASGVTFAGAGFFVRTRAFRERYETLCGHPGGVGNPLASWFDVHGQGTVNPPAGFVNHSLVRVGSAYYDPSYGNGPFFGTTEAQAQRAWERATLAAIVFDSIHDGITNRSIVALESSAVIARLVPSKTPAELSLTVCKSNHD